MSRCGKCGCQAATQKLVAVSPKHHSHRNGIDEASRESQLRWPPACQTDEGGSPNANPMVLSEFPIGIMLCCHFRQLLAFRLWKHFLRRPRFFFEHFSDQMCALLYPPAYDNYRTKNLHLKTYFGTAQWHTISKGFDRHNTKECLMCSQSQQALCKIFGTAFRPLTLGPWSLA